MHKHHHRPGVGGGWAVSSFNCCGHNLLRGVQERVFLVRDGGGVYRRPPLPQAGAFTRLERPARQLVVAVRRRWPCPTPVTADEFLSAYSGRRRVRYEKAVAESKVRAAKDSDYTLSIFPKVESTNGTFKEPVPRVISPRSPVYNYLVGRYLKPAEHRLFSAIPEVLSDVLLCGPRHPVVYKGLNADQRASALWTAWEAAGCDGSEPVALSFDFTRFDQHVSTEALRLEHSIYNMLFRSPELQRLLRRQLVNRCFGRMKDGSVIKYVVDGGRMSGDMNTSLGNCLLACLITAELLRSLGIRAQIVNDGDDTVIIMRRQHLRLVQEAMTSHFLGYGFQVRVDAVATVFERIVFCQFQPVWTQRGWTMVRDPRKSIETAACGAGKWASEQFPTLLWSAAACGLHMHRGIPVMWEFYNAMLRQGTRPRGGRIDEVITDNGFGRLAKSMAAADGLDLSSIPTYSAPCPKTRYSFWLAFGIEPELQLLLERHEWLFHPPTKRGKTHQPDSWDALRVKLSPSSPTLALHIACTSYEKSSFGRLT